MARASSRGDVRRRLQAERRADGRKLCTGPDALGRVGTGQRSPATCRHRCRPMSFRTISTGHRRIAGTSLPGTRTIRLSRSKACGRANARRQTSPAARPNIQNSRSTGRGQRRLQPIGPGSRDSNSKEQRCDGRIGHSRISGALSGDSPAGVRETRWKPGSGTSTCVPEDGRTVPASPIVVLRHPNRLPDSAPGSNVPLEATAKAPNQGREPVVNGSGEEAGMFGGHRRQIVPAPVKMPYRTIGDEQQVAGTAGIDLRSGHLDQARSIWMKRPVRSRTPGVVGAAGGKPAATRLAIKNQAKLSQYPRLLVLKFINGFSKHVQNNLFLKFIGPPLYIHC